MQSMTYRGNPTSAHEVLLAKQRQMLNEGNMSMANIYANLAGDILQKMRERAVCLQRIKGEQRNGKNYRRC